MKGYRKTGVFRLLEIAGEKRTLLTLSAVMSCAGSLLQLLPYLSAYFVLTEVLQYRTTPAAFDRNTLVFWSWVAGVSMIASLVFTYLAGICSHIAAFRILYGLRIRLAEHIGRLPLGFLSATSTGAIKKVLETNVEKIENFVAHGIPDCVGSLAMTVFIGAGLFSIDWRLALVALLPLAVAWFLLLRIVGGGKSEDFVRQYQDAMERMSASAVQFIRGMPAIKTFGQTVRSFRSFHGDIVKYRDFAIMLTLVWQNGFVGMQVILASVAAFILPAGLLLLHGYGDPAQAAAFVMTLLLALIVAPGITTPFTNAMMTALSMNRITEGVSRIDAIFATPPLREPRESDVRIPRAFDVAFEHVSFAYVGSEEAGENFRRPYALQNVSFTARERRITALVGPSGSGKSTVAHLIPRFWEILDGSIRFGGVDIRNIPTPTLMESVSFVFQDTFMLQDTICENIRVGKSDASQEEIVRAAKAAQCHDFIERLPHGYDTKIGEGGVCLSSGEEQRVAVARAILKNAPILVLDEATAFADPENEHRMHAALRELMKGKTVIVIAHRLQSIKNADQILVFKDGRIEERGRHEELLLQEGIYYRMWEACMDIESWTLDHRERLQANARCSA